jgi:hypothetical protein
MELGKSLQPLEALKTKLNFVHGLFNKPSTAVGIHPGQTGGLLSGAPLQKGSVIRAGVSMDQVLAERLGQETAPAQPGPRLRAAQHRLPRDQLLAGVQLAHLWQSPSSPVPLELYPALAFDSLFEDRGGKRLRGSWTPSADDVAGLHAGRLRRSGKLDEYTTSVRDVEKRIGTPARGDARGKGARADRRGHGPGPTAGGLPEDLREHMRLMCEVIALAFQTDRTRVARCCCAVISRSGLPFLDVRDGHHSPRTATCPTTTSASRATTAASSPSSPPASTAMAEGDGTVLDHSCLLFLSNMWAGWKHDNTRLARAHRRRPGRQHQDRAASSTTTPAPTRAASCAASTCPSWTAWASPSSASGMRTVA